MIAFVKKPSRRNRESRKKGQQRLDFAAHAKSHAPAEFDQSVTPPQHPAAGIGDECELVDLRERFEQRPGRDAVDRLRVVRSLANRELGDRILGIHQTPKTAAASNASRREINPGWQTSERAHANVQDR
jgi:hypothetical protein